MKATEQYFPVVLFIMLYKVVLTFESVDEVLKCNHSNESFLWCRLSCFTRWLYTFSLVDEFLQCDHSYVIRCCQYFPVCWNFSRNFRQCLCRFVFTRGFSKPVEKNLQIYFLIHLGLGGDNVKKLDFLNLYLRSDASSSST